MDTISHNLEEILFTYIYNIEEIQQSLYTIKTNKSIKQYIRNIRQFDGHFIKLHTQFVTMIIIKYIFKIHPWYAPDYIKHKKLSIIKYLYKKTNNGLTLKNNCIYFNNLLGLKYLLKFNNDIGSNSLYFNIEVMVRHDRLEMLQYLINNNTIDLNYYYNNNNKGYYNEYGIYSAKNDNLNMLKFLFKNNYRCDVQELLSFTNNPAIIKYLETL